MHHFDQNIVKRFTKSSILNVITNNLKLDFLNIQISQTNNMMLFECYFSPYFS